MAAISAVDQSDVELLVRVRAGDPAAEALLLERHRAAVAELGESPCFTSVDASGRLALAMVRQGADRDLPFRATWLALHAQGNVPGTPDRDVTVWCAFQSLPAAWRVAVWHREVEGQRPREIARLLGMSEEQAGRALGSAYAALKRRAAIAHSSSGISAECEDIVSTYRFSPPSSMPTAEIRALREHGRHCDDCLGLIRQLFLIEHTLRSTLAHVVMGPAADAYLARRPRVARLRVPGPEVVRTERRVHPVLASLSAAAIGAAAMSLVLSSPAISPVQDGRRILSAAPAPGQMLWPVDPSTDGSTGVFSSERVLLTPAAVDGALGPAGDPKDGDRGPDTGGSDPDGPDAPEPPVTPPVTPEPPVTPPTTPPTTPPGGGQVLDVDLSPGQATISVDPSPGTGPEDAPIVVEVPLPELPPVAPELPGTEGLGGLVP